MVRLMPAADRDLLEVDAEAGVALLPAGLAVVAVVDADDREVGRVHHRDGGERADVHQQLAVAGDDQHRLSGCASARPSPIMQGAPIAPLERKDVGAVARHSADVVRDAAEAGDDQEILVRADQLRHRFAAIEHDAGHRFERARPSEPSVPAASWPWPASERLGADQPLGQQHRDRLAALEHHGDAPR